MLVHELSKRASASARLRQQVEMEKQANLMKFMGGAALGGLKKAGKYALESASNPLSKGLPRIGTALGLAGAYGKAKAVASGFNENAQRAMLGMGPPKVALASVNHMNLESLMKTAAAADPVAMEKIAACIDVLDRLAPEYVPELVQEFQAYASYVEGKAKEAGVTDSLAAAWGKAKGPMGEIGVGAAKTIAGSLLVGLGIAASTDLLRMAKSKLTEGRNFKRMIEANPHLREKTPAELRQAFKSVQHFAPDVASDPLASGALVYRLANNLVGEHDRTLRDAVDIQKGMAEKSYLPGPKIEFGLTRPAPAARPPRPTSSPATHP